MTKPKSHKKKTRAPKLVTDLALGNEPGVAALVIDEIDKAVARYEKAKNRRCDESPAEIATKRELRKLLHENRERLHVDPETQERFYRVEGKDYVLSERLTIRKVESDDSPPIKETV